MSQDTSQILLGVAQRVVVASGNNTKMTIPQQQQSLPANGYSAARTGLSDTVVIEAKGVQSDRFKRIEESISDRNNAVALIRQTDGALDKVSSHIETMKANLGKIVKNYPPFSIDSKERMEILRTFISLRKEIDSMTIPAPPPQPSTELTSKIWQENALDSFLPAMTVDSPDTAVEDAYNQLGVAAQAVSDGRQELKNIL